MISEEVLERLVGALPDDTGGPRDLLAGCVRAELQRARVHAEQGQPVGEHVVHLAGDGLAGQPLGLLRAELRLRLGAPRAVAQTQHELPLGADEHAPADDGEREQFGERDRSGVRQVGVGAHPEEERGEGELDAADPGDVAEGPVHGQGEEDDHRGAARGVRDQADGDHRDREPERPAAAQPHRAAGEHPEQLVHNGQGVRGRGVVPEGLRRGQADEQGQQEADGVDDPVACGPAGPSGPFDVGIEFVGHGGRQQPAAPREGRRYLCCPVSGHGRQIYAGPGPVTHLARGNDDQSREVADFRRTRLAPRPGNAGRRTARG